MPFLAIALIISGEVLAIFAELRGAKTYAASPDFYAAFWPSMCIVIAGTTLLVIGYMLGLRYFQNVWIVTAVSLGSILLIEPVLNFLYMGQTPTLGAGIGFVLGAVGILSAILIK